MKKKPEEPDSYISIEWMLFSDAVNREFSIRPWETGVTIQDSVAARHKK